MLDRTMKRRVESTLRESFHLEQLRPHQRRAVETVLRGRDLLCVLPTGAGKSLCYQLPAMLREEPVLVISPLIALMRDQVAHLRERALPCAWLDSLQSPQEAQENLGMILSGRARLIYVSPERLQSAAFRRAIREHPPWMAVVDEAHCVVRWGKSFRPAYQDIAPMLSTLSRRPVICAMTATADRHLQRQLIRDLRMERVTRVVQPIRRDNLRFRSVLCLYPDDRAAAYARHHAGEKGVIFCRTRAACEDLERRLRACGVAAAKYHAGMEKDERLRIQQRFAGGELRVLAATTAFGMGVDIPDIRYVIQTWVCESVIDQVQQAGRAGRDGQAAECIQLIAPADLEWWRMHTVRAIGRMPRVQRYVTLLRLDRQMSSSLRIHLSGRCVSAGLSRAFGQHERPCGQCSACLRRKQGRPAALARVPHLVWMERQDVCAWALRIVRARLARERGVHPQEILPERILRAAALSGVLAPAGMDEEAYDRMEKVLYSITGRRLPQGSGEGRNA